MKIDAQAVGIPWNGAQPRANSGVPVAASQPAIARDGKQGGTPMPLPGDAALRAQQDGNRGRLPDNGHEVAFEYDHDAGKIIVRVIDPQTQQIVRQIPSEVALSISKTIGAGNDKPIHEKA